MFLFRTQCKKCQFSSNFFGLSDTSGWSLIFWENQLAECYRASLDLAAGNGCENIAFCCISTGIIMFPQEKASHIAVATDSDFRYNMMITGSKVPHWPLVLNMQYCCCSYQISESNYRRNTILDDEKKRFMQLTRCGNLAPDFKYPQTAVIFT